MTVPKTRTPVEMARHVLKDDPEYVVVKRQEVDTLRTRNIAALGLLHEVYESQNAACVGGPAPCGRCLWCRVRAFIRGKS